MRYRPFGPAGQAVSALTLSLGARDIAAGPEAGRELIYSALEAGINSYRLETADPVLAEVLGQALKHVDRRLVQVSLTLGPATGAAARTATSRPRVSPRPSTRPCTPRGSAGSTWPSWTSPATTNCPSRPSTP